MVNRWTHCLQIATALVLLCLLPTSVPAAHGASAKVPYVLFQIEGPGAQHAAEACMEAWEEHSLPLAEDLLPAGILPDTVVCLVLSSSGFAANFSHNLPDWGVGVALPTGRLVALDYSRLPAVGKTVREVFLHEMVHAMLFQAADQVRLPTWLHEGTAMLYSGEWRFRDTVSLAMDGRVPRLERLRGPFPSHDVGADRAYRTSLLAVNRLREKHGSDVVRRLLAASVRTGDFRSGFYETTGETVDDFSARFDRDMNLKYGWLVMVTRWPTLFVLIAIIFAVGASAKILRSRRRLAEMEDFED